MQCEITWVEVFATRPLGGNLLPVLSPADGVDDRVLATVARRFQQPETSFVQIAGDDRATYRHRIFTTTGELPFAGHPSLGTAAAVAHARRESSATYVQQTISGLQSLEVELDGTEGRVSIAQNEAEFADARVGAIDAVLGAVGLDGSALDDTLEPRIVSTGLPTLILPILDVDALASAQPDRAALDRLLPSAGLDAQTVYAVARSDDRWRARAFTHVVPSAEDAATGSAVGPFGAYLRATTGEVSAVVDQGVEMGSPSELLVHTDDGVVVTGAVRIVGRGAHELPTS